MNCIKLISLLLIQLVVTHQIQIPFNFNGLFSSKDVTRPHYTSVDPQYHPIDLSQYNDKHVVRIDYSNDPDLGKYLISLPLRGDANVHFAKWSHASNLKTIDIQIDKESLAKLHEMFPSMSFKVIVGDLAQKIFETYPLQVNQLNEDPVVANELFFKEYRSLETIDAWLGLLQATYPDIISVEEIGETYEHRKYKVVHFTVPSSEGNDDHGDRRTVVVSGGIHAREWISTSSVLYSIYALIEFYKNAPDSDIWSKLDFIFIPVSNPDGYEYTWTTDRLWRKNRQPTIHPKCFGIDIDHSYDYHWTRSSDWACGEEYSGEAPFEAFESQIWTEYLNNTNANHKIWGYIDLHSYSQEILYPYAFSCNEQPRDEENLLEVAWGLAKAIRMQSGTLYNVLPACIDRDADLMPDLGSGTALDYMYHHRADYAFQLKLRDTGNHGFLLPAKYIEPVGREVVAALKYLCNFLVDEQLQ